MAALAEAFVRIRAHDDGTLTRDINSSFGKVDTSKAGAAAGTKFNTGIRGKLKGLGKSINPMVAGAFAGAAVAALFRFGKDSASSFKEAESAQLRLSSAFEKFPQLAGYNVGSLRNLNTELAKKTRFDDDATASGQAALAQFHLTGDQIKNLTPLLQDYAAKTGKDLPSAALDLGKAIGGQGRALKAVGLNLKVVAHARAAWNRA
jgi:hypothetical protein